MIASLVPDLGALLVNWLAVLGGAAVGFFGSGALTQVLARAIAHKPVPKPMLTVVRLLGGIALGVAAYLLIFGAGSGGFGFGGGGGWGLGGRGTGGTGSSTPQPTGPQRSTGSTGGTMEPGQVLKVEMLGGKRYKGEVREQLDKDKDPYYLVEGAKEPQTWDEVRQMVVRRKSTLKEIEVIILQEGSVAEQHSAVEALRELARDHGLAWKVSKPGRKTP